MEIVMAIAFLGRDAGARRMGHVAAWINSPTMQGRGSGPRRLGCPSLAGNLHRSVQNDKCPRGGLPVEIVLPDATLSPQDGKSAEIVRLINELRSEEADSVHDSLRQPRL